MLCMHNLVYLSQFAALACQAIVTAVIDGLWCANCYVRAHSWPRFVPAAFFPHVRPVLTHLLYLC